jgi:hypothetical protein
MKGDFSQVIKWGMAGWCYFIESIVFILLIRLINQEFFSAIKETANFKWLTAAGVIAFISLVGVPLGFAFYQVYYFLLRTIPHIFRPAGEYYEKITSRCQHLSNTTKNCGANALYDMVKTVVPQSGLLRSLARLTTRKTNEKDISEAIKAKMHTTCQWENFRSCWKAGVADAEKGASPGTGIDLQQSLRRMDYLNDMRAGLGTFFISNVAAAATALVVFVYSFVIQLHKQYPNLELFVLLYLVCLVVFLYIIIKRLRTEGPFVQERKISNREIAVWVWFGIASLLSLYQLVHFVSPPSPEWLYGLLNSRTDLIADAVLVPVLIVGIAAIIHRGLSGNRNQLRMTAVMLFEDTLCRAHCTKRDECTGISDVR